ncbi:MAG: hypothetical protein WD100_09210 [Tistlia sp.]
MPSNHSASGPSVTAFYEPRTASLQYVVADPDAFPGVAGGRP